MSTPEIAGSRAVKNKYSPFGTGINRSLLTPCRQVGLSRKRKTSLNKSVKSLENLSNSFNDINGGTDDTTPLARSKISSERTKNRNQFINSQTTPMPNQESSAELSDKPKINKLPKKDLLQTFTSEDIFDASDDQPFPIEESKENKIVLPETEVPEKEDSDGEHTFKRRNSSTDDTTPLAHSKISSERTKNRNQFINSQTTPTPNQESSAELSDKPKINKFTKKDLLQTFTSEDIFDASDDQPFPIEESKENKIVLPETEVPEKEDSDGEHTFKRRNSRKFKKRRLSSSFSYSSLSYDSDNDFVQSNSAKQGSNMDLKCSKSISKISLHILEGNSSQSDNLKEINCAKKCKVELHKLSDNEMKRNNSLDNNTSNTLKKKYSNSIDDADFFTSTPEGEKTKRKSLEKKIVVLESQIKQKKSVLENLQRASIYKSKHNIPELKRLTSLWLEGCVQSLKDLLTHLQAHGPMDLTTLLNNMQIPKEIIAKLPL